MALRATNKTIHVGYKRQKEFALILSKKGTKSELPPSKWASLSGELAQAGVELFRLGFLKREKLP